MVVDSRCEDNYFETIACDPFSHSHLFKNQAAESRLAPVVLLAAAVHMAFVRAHLRSRNIKSSKGLWPRSYDARLTVVQVVQIRQACAILPLETSLAYKRRCCWMFCFDEDTNDGRERGTEHSHALPE